MERKSLHTLPAHMDVRLNILNQRVPTKTVGTTLRANLQFIVLGIR